MMVAKEELEVEARELELVTCRDPHGQAELVQLLVTSTIS